MREVHVKDILKAGHLLFWYYFIGYLNWGTAFIWNYLILPILNARIENN